MIRWEICTRCKGTGSVTELRPGLLSQQIVIRRVSCATCAGHGGKIVVPGP